MSPPIKAWWGVAVRTALESAQRQASMGLDGAAARSDIRDAAKASTRSPKTSPCKQAGPTHQALTRGTAAWAHTSLFFLPRELRPPDPALGRTGGTHFLVHFWFYNFWGFVFGVYRSWVVSHLCLIKFYIECIQKSLVHSKGP